MKKTFVIDTNIILNDYNCIYKFDDNDIIISTTVLEELDKFKKYDDVKSYNARKFIRELDKLFGDVNSISKGISLGKDKGKIYLKGNSIQSKKIYSNFDINSPDNKILSLCDELNKTKLSVILVTMDVNLRLKAKSVGIKSEEYKNIKIKDVKVIDNNNIVTLEVNDDVITELYKNGYIDFNSNEYIYNQNFILKSKNSSGLGCYCKQDNKIVKVDKQNIYGILPKNAEQTFAIHALLDDNIKIIALSGISGSGKTLLSIASAIEQRKKFHQIYITRPTIVLNNNDSIGFLPGDIQSKMGVYLNSYYDNINFLKSNFKKASPEPKIVEEMLQNEKIKIEPLQFIRGRSLNDVMFLIDESQNLDKNEMKTILTRCGNNVKIVFTGDLYQIDVPTLNSENNGFAHLINNFNDKEMFTHIKFNKGERSKISEMAWKIL